MVKGIPIPVKSFDITISCLKTDNRTMYSPSISDIGLTSVNPHGEYSTMFKGLEDMLNVLLLRPPHANLETLYPGPTAEKGSRAFRDTGL